MTAYSTTGLGQVQAVSRPTGRYSLTLAADSWSVCYQADSPGQLPTTGGTSKTGYLPACQGDYIPVTVGHTSTGIDIALGHGGAIAGRVTDSAGHPLAGIVVQSAVGYNGAYDTGVRTKADGSYRLPGLPEADWKICFDATGTPAPGGLLHQCYLNTDVSYGHPYSQDGTFVAVTVDSTSTGVDGHLHPGAAVSGRVTDPAGRPVPGILVEALPDSGNFTSTTTRADGSYLISALPPGAYSVCFYPYFSDSAPASARTYNRQCYHQSFPYRDPNLTLTAGQRLTGVDAHLDHGGSVRVSVTDPAGHPLGNVTVTVDGAFQGTSAVTSDAGVAQVDGVEAGQHRVCFYAVAATGGSSEAGYLDDCYLNQPDFSHATPVTVTTGAVTSISEKLPAAGGVRLTVTDDAGHPLRGISASYTLVGANSGIRPAERTDADGHLLLGRLATGDYQICLDAGGTDGNGAGVSGGDSRGGYRDRCVFSGDDPPAVVGVQVGQLTELPMKLSAMGAIGGTVTDLRGHPLRYVAVTITRRDGFYQPYFLRTGADGAFSLTRLEDAPYSVCFDAGQGYPLPVSGGDSDTGYLNECFDDSTLDAPTEVQVSAGALSRTDASLSDGAAIVGTLTDRTGSPVPDVQLSVSKDGFAVGGTGYSDADGHYRITSLPPGSGYLVCAYPSWQSPSPNGLGYARQCYLDAPDESSATPVSVTAGQARTIDFTLQELASLGGTVTDSHGNPVDSEQVTVTGPGGTSYLLYTAPDGSWRQDGIPAGNYTLCYQSYYGTGPSPTGYAPGCYDGQPVGATPTPIAVAAGEHHTVDLRLVAPSAITGHVTDPDGQPVFAPVNLMQGDTVLATVMPDFDTGAYQFGGLAAGDYTVFFDADSWGYQSRYYHDVLPGGTPTTVSVPAETTVSGIDQTLSPAG
ncbi:carboxypeptidase regulatory-like domain-containing protein [Jatrophihabitans sp.]|uniref:carboxypeptidase regulatory-like domain-containing protein n=1 Tax=Jatrophihabitans sp. TaxID=1932789 RepID=UPI002C7170E0|nr:carboxypeptidase-like regulatory domain-containing protein [Jatrophihabitans sp.]